MITIQTDHEFCVDQPDYQIHNQAKELKLNCSAGQDNHSDLDLINETLSRLDSDQINCLDLGCAGGQLILDYNKSPKTNICIGLDGSCGVYKHPNWGYDKREPAPPSVLRHADLTKPFVVLDEGAPVTFDIITCWEVIEHFEETDLDIFFTNVFKHLNKGGLFFGSIALFEDTRDSDGFHQSHHRYKANDIQFKLHKTVFKEKEPWDKILSNYFQVVDYDLQIKLRNHSNSYYFMCQHKRDDTI